ncbi:unnamed protein product, partial [Ectocarpus fasciculatus]
TSQVEDSSAAAANALAARSAAASAIAKPFVSRKLGSFEKMLTQTQDGAGPAEDGIRTLTTPHVWAAVIDGDLPRSSLKRGIEAVLARHPMLRACIRTPDGPKEPLIDITGKEREDGDPLYFCESECESLGALAERVLSPEEDEISGDEAFAREWQGRLERNLDNARLPVSAGPNWRVETIRLSGPGSPGRRSRRTALVCTMNHALEDQRSSNVMLQGILEAAAGTASGPADSADDDAAGFDLPPSMEAAIVEGKRIRRNTLWYMWAQARATIAKPVVLPDGLPSVTERIEGGDEGPFGVKSRKSTCEFSSVSADDVSAMLQACSRERGLTLSGALSAACQMACSDVAHAEGSRGSNLYKFLLAVDLRRFGSGEYSDMDDWTGGTVACAGGAIEYAVKVPAGSGSRLVGRNGEEAARVAREEFWRLAKRCKTATRDMVEKETLREAVAFFDWVMDNIHVWKSVDIESRNAKTLGRAYTCGVSNMGRYPFDTEVGNLSLKAVHYGTSQSTRGSLFQLSCGTIDGELFMTLQFAEPLVTRKTGEACLQGIIDNLRAACGISS